MSTRTIPLNQLRAHPDNSNVMPDVLIDKLAMHIRRTGRYPPLIVRPIHRPTDTPGSPPSGDDAYQILDGHHRARALNDVGLKTAECIIWEADDQEARVLLATLNRLQGQDDPRKRAKLIKRLRDQHDLKQLTHILPERAEQLKKYLEFSERTPAPRNPKPLDQMPVAVYFFLKPEQKSRLNNTLSQFEGSREEALMKLIDSSTP